MYIQSLTMTAVMELLHEWGKESDAVAGIQAGGGGDWDEMTVREVKRSCQMQGSF